MKSEAHSNRFYCDTDFLITWFTTREGRFKFPIFLPGRIREHRLKNSVAGTTWRGRGMHTVDSPPNVPCVKACSKHQMPEDPLLLCHLARD